MQLAGHGKDPRLVQAELTIVPNVGDHIKDGLIGEIYSINDHCINAKNETAIKSYNLKLSHSTFLEVLEPIRKPVLVEDFAVSISGESIIYDPNAKPIEFTGHAIVIAENRELYDLLKPICDYYSGRQLATFAVNALGHALPKAKQGKINAAVELLTDVVMAEVVKPEPEVKRLREFLNNFVPSIDAVELPQIVDAIATEPSKSVANLRMDEGSFSVLVGIVQPVLVENERLTFLLKRREQLIESGASPKGVWLNCGKVPRRDFIQVAWKSDKPHEWLGGAKSRYIGKENSDEHKSAIAQHKAGQELRVIEREIKKLQVKS